MRGLKTQHQKLRIASSAIGVENTKVGVERMAGAVSDLETVWCTERNTKFRLLTRV
jgi:hypothetical protein